MKLSSKLAAVVLVGAVSQASALSMASFSPYAGVDLEFKSLSLKGMNGSTFPKQAPGMSVIGGLEVLPNLNVEASLHRAAKSKNAATVRHKGLGVAIVGAYCLNEKLNLLSSAGVNHLRYKYNHESASVANKKLRPKIGLGLGYQVTPAVSWRTMGSWTGNFGKKPVDYTPKQSLGISTGLVVKL